MSKSIKLYARYDCNGGNAIHEDLIEHLRNVGELAYQIAEKILPDFKNGARISGHFHDLFKVAFQSKPNCQEDPNWKMVFPYHEVASAVFLANYILRYDLNLKEDEAKASVKAVLMHHQGLRSISTESFFGGFKRITKIIFRNRSKIEEYVSLILEKLGYNTHFNLSDMLHFDAIKGFLIGGNENHRFLAGILMLADNYTAASAVNQETRRLLELEIREFLKYIGIMT